ncbi:unnamed protein product [Durusdinium trenchii]|uniref:Uncharacterized protein n=2 Tax=Durusdinium trenchii TaxID=1381693 RepID=A0ABP0MYP1_9DINO
MHPCAQPLRICDSNSRISVKLEYYRDHLEQHEPLIRKVEETFMCQVPDTGEPIVNVAKLRSARPKSQGLSRAARMRIKQRTLTPPVKERSDIHRAKISAALVRAQFLHLERRTEQAWRQQLQHSRQERARRERPWLAVMGAIAALAAMKRVVTVWREAKSLALSDVQWRIPFVYGLKAIHLERLSASALVMQKEERKRQRHEAIWKEWKKLLRTLIVYVKFRLPLKKTRSIDKIKSFMRASARPYMLRRTVKHFVQSVLLVQRALRHQAHIFRTVQQHILQPFVWATETQLLCDAFRMRKAEAATRIEAYLEEVKLKEWEKEVKLMWLDRAQVWRDGSRRFRPQLSRHEDHPSVHLEEDHIRHVASAPARMHNRPTGRGSQLQKTLDMIQPQGHGRKTFSLRKSLHGRNFLVMDTLRMDPRDAEEITRQMLLNSVDAWWSQYRTYRSAEELSKQNWINWRQDVLRRPDALIWDAPEVLKYPEMSFSAQGYQWLHKEVENRLRERPEFRSLIGEGF